MAGATEIYQFEILCSPITPKNTPQITNITMPTRTVQHIRVRIPPGPNGVMGFAIGSTGETVIPTVDGTFIVASDEVIEWEPDGFIDSGSWQVQMYNIGVFDHTIYVTFTTVLPDLANPVNADISPEVSGLSAPATAAPVTVSTDLPAPPALS